MEPLRGTTRVQWYNNAVAAEEGGARGEKCEVAERKRVKTQKKERRHELHLLLRTFIVNLLHILTHSHSPRIRARARNKKYVVVNWFR